MSTLNDHTMNRNLPLNMNRLAKLFQYKHDLLNALLCQQLKYKNQLLNRGKTLTSVPSLNHTRKLLRNTTTNVLFNRLLNTTTNDLVLLLVRPTQYATYVRLAQFTRCVSSLLYKIFLFGIYFYVLVDNSTFEIRQTTLFFRGVGTTLRYITGDPIRVLRFRHTRIICTKPITLNTNRVNRVSSLVGLKRSQLTNDVTTSNERGIQINSTPLHFNRSNNNSTIPSQRQAHKNVFYCCDVVNGGLRRLLLKRFLNKVIRGYHRDNLFQIYTPTPNGFCDRFFCVFHIHPTLFTRTNLSRLLNFKMVRNIFPSPS